MEPRVCRRLRRMTMPGCGNCSDTGYKGRVAFHELVLITEEELLSQLRLQGVDNLADVQAAFIEGDGRVSVVKRDESRSGSPDSRRVT